MALLSAAPSSIDTDRVGMVMVASVPLMPGAPALAALLAISTAIAPAVCMFLVFTANPQAPRSTSAIAPVTLVGAVQPSAGAATTTLPLTLKLVGPYDAEPLASSP